MEWRRDPVPAVDPATGKRNHLRVLCVGLSRSGSTWQYNMVRELVTLVAASAAATATADPASSASSSFAAAAAVIEHDGTTTDNSGGGVAAVAVSASELFSDLHECLHAQYCVARGP